MRQATRQTSDDLVVSGKDLAALRLRFVTEGPREAAERLGTSARQVRLAVERVVQTCAERLEAEGWLNTCQSQREAVVLHVAGTRPSLDARTESHLWECAMCRQAALDLEDAARMVAGAPALSGQHR